MAKRRHCIAVLAMSSSLLVAAGAAAAESPPAAADELRFVRDAGTLGSGRLGLRVRGGYKKLASSEYALVGCGPAISTRVRFARMLVWLGGGYLLAHRLSDADSDHRPGLELGLEWSIRAGAWVRVHPFVEAALTWRRSDALSRWGKWGSMVIGVAVTI